MKNTKTYTFEELINRLPDVLVNALKNSMQDPIWHPEGSVYTHTKMVFEYAKKNFPGNNDLLVCAIFHDLAKPETQTIKARDKSFKGDPSTLPWKKQKISNLYHDIKAKNYIEKYFDLFSDITTNKEKILEIVDNHLRAHIYLSGEMRKPFKRNKFESLKYFKELLHFEECDSNGKSVKDDVYSDVKNDAVFLIKLYDFGFFNEKYHCLKDENKKIKLKNSIMNFLIDFHNSFNIINNHNIYMILDSLDFEDFIQNQIKKYKIDVMYHMALSNKIFSYCQKIMENE